MDAIRTFPRSWPDDVFPPEDPAIHVFLLHSRQDVDARDKPAHDRECERAEQ